MLDKIQQKNINRKWKSIDRIRAVPLDIRDDCFMATTLPPCSFFRKLIIDR